MTSHITQRLREITYRHLATALCAMCLLLLLVYTGVGSVTAEETTVNMTIDNEDATGGAELVVFEDPETNITVTANTPIDLLEIRVNGDIYRSYRPNSTQFDRSLTLELDPNENTVETIVKTDGITTIQTAVTKHTAAPRVRYTSPFSTTIKGGPNSTVNVTSGQVTLAGDLHTMLDVERVRIERTTDYGPGENSSQVDRRIHRISNPGDSFSQELLLANGTNEIVAEYTDSRGRTNTDRFSIILDDETDPQIEFTAENESYTDTAHVSGIVRDETKLTRVEINRTSNNGSQVLLLSGNAKPNPDMLKYEFDTTVDLYDDNDDNEFQITAEDAAGNIRNRTFSIRYDPEPDVSVTEATTNVETETVRVTGTVSDAEIGQVTVETVDTRTGERMDLVRPYDAGSFTDKVNIDQELKASPENTLVYVLVKYRTGEYTTKITPDVPDTQQDTDADTDTASATTTNSTNSTETNTTTQNARSEDTGNSSVSDTDGPSGDGSPSDAESESPTLLPIRTRDAFGGIVIVGGTYLLGHWV
ncbi:hypothetical protein R3751_07755 [Halorubrum distributum]|uniref:hypothetical protein n=1 Tax=Halorubrum distributum TaxID=29283 RepID=UPI00295494DC|nr:hypothetical protein [Halorubrum distributum]MDV7349668.1 hypothetical protein [Halorubrum distributum]